MINEIIPNPAILASVHISIYSMCSVDIFLGLFPNLRLIKLHILYGGELDFELLIPRFKLVNHLYLINFGGTIVNLNNNFIRLLNDCLQIQTFEIH